jgi:GT2 family glycosyltransferase
MENLTEHSTLGTWPRVSVIIVNWNGAQFLHRCLTALMAQTVPPYEIILLDNASSDNSFDIVKGFSSVQFVSLSENTGFARGNNLAINLSSSLSEWIALINPDAFAQPQWLENLLAAAHSYPEFSVFGSKLLTAADPNILDGAGDVYHLSGLVWRAGHGTKVDAASSNNREIFSPCAAAAMYQRSAVIAGGGFDEDFFCYLEDVDLGFRLRLAGHRCLYVANSVAHHVGSGTSGGKDSDFALYYGHRNLVWTFVKNMPGVLFWLMLPAHLLLNVASLVGFTLRGRGKIIWRAKKDAFLGLPKMWLKRQTIQDSREASVTGIWQLVSKRSFAIKYFKPTA